MLNQNPYVNTNQGAGIAGDMLPYLVGLEELTGSECFIMEERQYFTLQMTRTDQYDRIERNKIRVEKNSKLGIACRILLSIYASQGIITKYPPIVNPLYNEDPYLAFGIGEPDKEQ